MDAIKKPKTDKKQVLRIMGRVLRYMLKSYKFSFFIVIVCIVGSALATLRGTLFLQSLIDDYIVPLTQTPSPDFSALAGALLSVAGTYAIGIVCAYTYNRIMVNVSQGTMRNLRIQLFAHMESLPIKYFDTHAHGDIMSVYTNDVDLPPAVNQPEHPADYQFVCDHRYVLHQHADSGYPADADYARHGRRDASDHL